jgi:hypothetical protein
MSSCRYVTAKCSGAPAPLSCVTSYLWAMGCTCNHGRGTSQGTFGCRDAVLLPRPCFPHEGSKMRSTVRSIFGMPLSTRSTISACTLSPIPQSGEGVVRGPWAYQNNSTSPAPAAQVGRERQRVWRMPCPRVSLCRVCWHPTQCTQCLWFVIQGVSAWSFATRTTAMQGGLLL